MLAIMGFIPLRLLSNLKAEAINSLYEKGDKDELMSALKSYVDNPEVLPSVWSMLKPEVQKELTKLGYKPTSQNN